MDTFERCHEINDYICAGEEAQARNELIKLLANLEIDNEPYTPVLNHLIRSVGLYPYLDKHTCDWEEQFVIEAFKADVGLAHPVTLHREQYRLLNALISGSSIAVSAPTSFGKSFVIDSFISIKQPSTVVILVPTIALADETRRRLQRKFGATYKLITTSDQTLAAKNIFVFPQERVLGYLSVLEHVDILIVDEFYKASKEFDKQRSPALIRSIIELSKIAKQRYFLAPNISTLEENPFTQGMEFMRLDFNTVFLEKTDLYHEIGRDEEIKSRKLLEILDANPGKSLIYAGTYTNIRKLSNMLMSAVQPKGQNLLDDFSSWLSINYDPNWELTKLASRGVGVHNGQLHRSLSQIQVQLFEEMEGFGQLISTSSIIEGVNTSAQNVILWSNKNGQAKINDFTYKNIIGRSGRMFRHFIGKVFVLEQPPEEESTQLSLTLPDELLGSIDSGSNTHDLTSEQLEAIHAYDDAINKIAGSENLAFFKNPNVFQSSNTDLILEIALNIHSDRTSWNGLQYLNSNDPDTWSRLLYKLINLLPGGWEIQYSKYVEFVKLLIHNWEKSIPELLDDLSQYDIGIEEFFKLERNTTFKLASLLSDVGTVYNRLTPDAEIDLSPAISRISNAFLPPIVYQLEEYGVPRMISRKIQASGLIDLTSFDHDIHDVLNSFRQIGIDDLIGGLPELSEFDIYILRYFYDGIGYNQN